MTKRNFWTTLGRNHPCVKASDRAAEYGPEVIEQHQKRCRWYRENGMCRITRPVGKRRAKKFRYEEQAVRR